MPSAPTSRAVVLAGGDPVGPRVRSRLPDDAIVIAADSGLAHAAGLGLAVDEIVGDLDSADPAAVDAAVAAGARVDRHPAAKDATDLELALGAACAHGAERITVVGGAGGRLDHLLANVAVLASPRFAGAEIDALMGDAHLAVVRAGRPPHPITGPPGSLVTLLPVGGDARGVTTAGLEYALDGETLPAGTSRGVSNVVAGGDASVLLTSGTLIVVQPEGARP